MGPAAWRIRRVMTLRASKAFTVAAAKQRVRSSNTVGSAPGGVTSTRPNVHADLVQGNREAGADQTAADDQNIMELIHAAMISLPLLAVGLGVGSSAKVASIMRCCLLHRNDGAVGGWGRR